VAIIWGAAIPKHAMSYFGDTNQMTRTLLQATIGIFEDLGSMAYLALASGRIANCEAVLDHIVQADKGYDRSTWLSDNFLKTAHSR